MQVTDRNPTVDDILHVATHMRAADVAECMALGERDLVDVLTDGVRRSVWSRTVLIDGIPACILGVAPHGALLTATTGVPWMLGTDLVPRNRRALIRTAPLYIDDMLRTFSHLLNYVHADNTLAVRWLRRVGFTLHDAQPVGVNGAMFHRFEMRLTDV